MTWTYKGSEITEPVPDTFGFVYCITNLVTGKKYIGRKNWYSMKKKKGEKRRKKSESDWKSYYGSNDILKKDVEELGKENFSREILILAETVGLLGYFEENEQHRRGVLFDDGYYNDCIGPGRFRSVKKPSL